MNIREHILEKSPMSALTVGRPSMTDQPLQNMREYMLGKNPMNVMSVGKLSVIIHPFSNMRRLIGKKPCE